MPADAERLSEEEWAIFLENWKIGLSSSTPKARLRSQWKSLLQQYSRRYNSVVQTASDFELELSNPLQPFAPWAMDNIDHNLLDLLLTAEFFDHFVEETQLKSKPERYRARKSKLRMKIGCCLGFSVWKIYICILARTLWRHETV